MVSRPLHVLQAHLTSPQALSTAPSVPPNAFSLQDAVSTSTSTSAIPTPPELEATLALLSGHRSVLGYLLVSRGQPVSIIRHSGVVFEGEQGRKYATAIARMVESVQGALEEVSGEPNEGDDIRFMRIRTKRHEIMISPGASCVVLSAPLHLAEPRTLNPAPCRQEISARCAA
ncbi:hypothetical protein EVG20_g10395, partial [Dentipellis fragilis]